MILPASYQVLIMYFLALQPGYRCTQNSTSCTTNTTYAPNDNFRCHIHRGDWEYAKPRHFSIATHFDIHCDNEWLLQLTTGIYFVGAAVGGTVLGKLADTIGRRHVLFLSLGCTMLNGLVSAFAPNIYFFIVQRFLAGLFYAGTLGQMVVMAAELVGAHRRPFAGNSVWLFYSLASCALALKAHFIRDWQIILVTCTVPYSFVLILYKFVPESVRWLIHKEKTEQVDKIWKTIAKWNNRSLSNVTMKKPEHSDDRKTSGGFRTLFVPAPIGVQTLFQGYIWMTTSMIFYALSLAAGDLGGDLYRNFALVSIMECPGHISGAFLSNRFGRKPTSLIPILIASLTCATIPLIPVTGPVHIVRVGLGMMGKFFITTCYSCIYLRSAETFPTKNRAKGIGLMQVFEMTGGACAPFVVMKLASINKMAPFFLLSACGLLATLLMMFLPETKNKNLK